MSETAEAVTAVVACVLCFVFPLVAYLARRRLERERLPARQHGRALTPTFRRP